MSDLISRSALIEILEDYENDDWNKNISAMLSSVVDDCIDFIENMPTAYDIDKVVEELETDAERWEDSGKDYNDKCEIAVGKGLRIAIEIVKQDYVFDNVKVEYTCKSYPKCLSYKYCDDCPINDRRES